MEDSIPKPSSKHSPSQWGHDVNNPPAVPVDGERNGAPTRECGEQPGRQVSGRIKAGHGHWTKNTYEDG